MGDHRKVDADTARLVEVVANLFTKAARLLQHAGNPVESLWAAGLNPV